MNIKREIFRRYTITGPTEDRNKAFAFCVKHNLRICFAGPVRLRGKRESDVREQTGARGILIDDNRFRLVAEGPVT